MTAAAELRGIDVMSAPLEPAPLPDGVSALLLDDFLAALMLRPDPGNAVDALPGADAMARLEELVGRGLEAGVTRIVAISAPRRPQGGLPLSVIAAAREFEALLARAGAGHAVVLRTLEVSDPMAGATQAVVRRLLRGDGFASAASDPFRALPSVIWPWLPPPRQRCAMSTGAIWILLRIRRSVVAIWRRKPNGSGDC